MLKKSFIAEIAKLTKIPESAITAAITATEEVDVMVKGADGKETAFDPAAAGLEVFTKDELLERDKNTATAKFPEARKAAQEIIVKELKKATGFESELTDPAEVAKAIVTDALKKAKLEPSEAVKEKDKQIEVLKATLATETAKIQEAEKKAATVQRERELLGAFPANLTGDLSPDERIALFNMRYESTEVDGVGTVWKDKKTGTELRDKTGKAAPLTEIASAFATEKKWIEPAKDPRQGQGGKDSGGAGGARGTITKYSEAVKAWKADGKSLNDGAGFQAFLGGHAKDNAAFEYDLDTPTDSE